MGTDTREVNRIIDADLAVLAGFGAAELLYIPVASHSPGAVGSLWRTDLYITNVDDVAIDVAIAVDHLSLAAVAEGLGTCWIGAFDADLTRRILGIPADIIPVILLPLGYPRDPQPAPKRRLPLEQIVHDESW